MSRGDDEFWPSDDDAPDAPPRTVVKKSNGHAANDEWPEIVPLDHTGELPPFPLDALPKPLADWAAATAEASQTPVDLAALLALSTASAVVAKRYQVLIKPGWVEPLNLFVVAAMEPGERKSAVFRSAQKPVLEYERDMARDMAPEITRATARKEVKDKEYRKAVEKAAKSSDGQDTESAAILLDELTNMKVPAVPRHFADDTTPEKLGVMMAEQGGRMALFSSEGGIFETMAGRYSEGVANLDLVLKGYSGDHFRVDRIRREPIVISSPALTIALTVQPQVIRGLAAKPEFKGRGLLGRFLYSMPQSKMGRRSSAPPEVPDRAANAYSCLFQKLLRDRPKLDEYGEVKPLTIGFEPEALNEFLRMCDELEPKLGPGGELEPIRDHASKHMGALARIAAVMHICEFFDEDDWLGSADRSDSLAGVGTNTEGLGVNIVNIVNIGLKGVLKLKDISRYLLLHAKSAYALMGTDENQALAERILSWAKRNDRAVFTKRDAWRSLHGSLQRIEQLDKPLALLVEHGFIREEEQPRNQGAGRKASPAYSLAPTLSPSARN